MTILGTLTQIKILPKHREFWYPKKSIVIFDPSRHIQAPTEAKLSQDSVTFGLEAEAYQAWIKLLATCIETHGMTWWALPAVNPQEMNTTSLLGKIHKSLDHYRQSLAETFFNTRQLYKDTIKTINRPTKEGNQRSADANQGAGLFHRDVRGPKQQSIVNLFYSITSPHLIPAESGQFEFIKVPEGHSGQDTLMRKEEVRGLNVNQIDGVPISELLKNGYYVGISFKDGLGYRDPLYYHRVAPRIFGTATKEEQKTVEKEQQALAAFMQKIDRKEKLPKKVSGNAFLTTGRISTTPFR